MAVAEANRDKQYEDMKKRIQYLYENGGSNAWAQMLLESDSITGLLSRAEYTEKMYQYDRDELKKMKETVQEVTDLGNQLAQEKAELEEDETVKELDPPLDMKEMFLPAIATSIDALAVGITFAFLNYPIVECITIIGLTTFVLSIAGVVVGNMFGSRYQKKAEIAGGIILILIGLKILFEHLGILVL